MKIPVQIAYFVPDVRQAALQHSKMFGSGPFFVADHITFSECSYRGAPTDWDHTSAFGQWGDIMVEFMQQNKPGASVLHDVFPEQSGRNGVHHMAYFVDDPAGRAAELEKAGFQTALRGKLTNGIEVFMVDTIRSYGHMLELYEPSETILSVYEFIRTASVDFDGNDPVRSISL